MAFDLINTLLVFFRTISQILTAGIAITAFSLLMFLVTLNTKDKVIRSFGVILVTFVIIYSAEAFGSTTPSLSQANFWLQIQWVGIILLPAAYFQFSDAILATTGKPSRGRRTWLIRFIYLICLICLVLLATNHFVGSMDTETDPVVRLTPTTFTHLFSVFYVLVIGFSWYNFIRAYNRTTTYTSRRRIAYILIGGLVPAIGSFPFLLFGSDFAAQHSLFFWMVVASLNTILGGFIVITAYAVSFFGASWPDRLVKSRIFSWILRGPVIASLTLGITTIIRRLGEIQGESYSTFVPISMVITIILGQYLITILTPLMERWFVPIQMREELDIVKRLENSLLTRQDLGQFLETVLAAVCDQLQAPGAYLVSLDNGGLELVVSVGESDFEELKNQADVGNILSLNGNLKKILDWNGNLLIPLVNNPDNDHKTLLGFMVISRSAGKTLDDEARDTLNKLANRAEMALRDRFIQKKIFDAVEELTPQMNFIQQMRAAGSYDKSLLLGGISAMETENLPQIVKEALTDYWGGPRLTGSPLIKLKVVQDALGKHNDSGVNALRSILKQAIERTRPQGERHFTGEWILYNILEMKFMEGRKVRDIAMRLAMSEADLYRKQKVAIENVARILIEMEEQANEASIGEGNSKRIGFEG